MVVGLDGRVLLEGFPSGVSQAAAEVFLRLIAAAPEWQFVVFVSGQDKRLLDERTQEFVGKPNVRIVKRQIPNRILNLLISFFGWPHLDQLAGGVDVWFAPNIGFVATHKAQLVLLVHDTTFVTYAGLLRSYTRCWLSMIRPKKLLLRADAVITPSEHSRKSILQEFPSVPEEHVSVLPFGPPQPPQRSEQAWAKVQDRFQLPQRFCVTLGTLEPRKNIRTLVEGWSPAMGTLVVVGAKGWDQLPRQAQVQYVGYLTQEEKWTVLQHADCLIYPTIAEGFGLPLLEAFAAGTPVIAGPHTSLVEVGQDAVLWTNVHHQQALHQAVQSLQTDDTLRQRLVSRGRSVLDTFSWDRSIQQLKQVMQGVTPQANRTL
ncbi:MAG: glycosyltransferase family 1 protein [Patescibacteria group bacterium]